MKSQVDESMIDCKHYTRVYMDYSGVRTSDRAEAMCLRCSTCRLRIGLSLELKDRRPANDTPDALVELRAAEIAARHDDLLHELSSRFKTNEGEIAGWRGEETFPKLTVIGSDWSRRVDHDVPRNLNSANWRAGYLARVIATHDSHSDERADDADPRWWRGWC